MHACMHACRHTYIHTYICMIYDIYISTISDLKKNAARQVLRPSCQRCFGGKSTSGRGSMQLHPTPKTSPQTETVEGPRCFFLFKNGPTWGKNLGWKIIVFLFEVSDFTLSQAISRFGWSLQRTTKLEQPLGCSKSHMLRPLRQDPRLAFGWIFQRQHAVNGSYNGLDTALCLQKIRVWRQVRLEWWGFVFVCSIWWNMLIYTV